MYYNSFIKTLIVGLVCVGFSFTNYASANEVEADLVVQLDDPHIQIGSNFSGKSFLFLEHLIAVTYQNQILLLK